MAAPTRPREGRWIAGVCAGLARWGGRSPNEMRWVFAMAGALLFGLSVVVYLVLWIIMPSE